MQFLPAASGSAADWKKKTAPNQTEYANANNVHWIETTCIARILS